MKIFLWKKVFLVHLGVFLTFVWEKVTILEKKFFCCIKKIFPIYIFALFNSIIFLTILIRQPCDAVFSTFVLRLPNEKFCSFVARVSSEDTISTAAVIVHDLGILHIKAIYKQMFCFLKLFIPACFVKTVLHSRGFDASQRADKLVDRLLLCLYVNVTVTTHKPESVVEKYNHYHPATAHRCIHRCSVVWQALVYIRAIQPFCCAYFLSGFWVLAVVFDVVSSPLFIHKCHCFTYNRQQRGTNTTTTRGITFVYE